MVNTEENENAAKTLCFEAKLARLQDIVLLLENESTPIEEALKAFEEGVSLSRELGEQLDNIRQKIEILKKDAEGRLQLRPFEEEK